MDRRYFFAKSTKGVLCALLASKDVSAVVQGNFQEGKHYQRLEPVVPVTVPNGRIEVIDFFWYGCPHCYAFEPKLTGWVRTLPSDVFFRRVHVAFRSGHEPQQRLYLTLEALKKVDLLHRQIFEAIHQNGVRLDRPEEIFDFVAAHGLDRNEFADAYKSFAIQAKAHQGKNLSAAYKIDGVPSIGIHGRYLTSPAMAGAGAPDAEGQMQALKLADYLISMVRGS